jgi:hypothetical protein
MTVLRRLRRTRSGTFHVKWPTPKHVENSIRGILYAIAHMFARIDLDMSITKPDPHCPLRHGYPGPCRGHVVGCHWPLPMRQDGFYDPLSHLHPDTPIWAMTAVEALRLVTGDGHRMQLIETLIGRCGTEIGALLEPKGDPRFTQDWPWQHILDTAIAAGCHVEVYALPQNAAALPVARRVGGFKAWEIQK